MLNGPIRELADLLAAHIDPDLIPVPHTFTLSGPGADDRATIYGNERNVGNPHLYVGKLFCHLSTNNHGFSLADGMKLFTYETFDFTADEENYSRSQFHTDPRLAVFHNIIIYKPAAFDPAPGVPALDPAISNAYLRFYGYRLAHPSI